MRKGQVGTEGGTSSLQLSTAVMWDAMTGFEPAEAGVSASDSLMSLCQAVHESDMKDWS